MNTLTQIHTLPIYLQLSSSSYCSLLWSTPFAKIHFYFYFILLYFYCWFELKFIRIHSFHSIITIPLARWILFSFSYHHSCSASCLIYTHHIHSSNCLLSKLNSWVTFPTRLRTQVLSQSLDSKNCLPHLEIFECTVFLSTSFLRNIMTHAKSSQMDSFLPYEDIYALHCFHPYLVISSNLFFSQGATTEQR